MPDPIWEEKLSFLVEQDHSMREVLIKKNILSDTYHPEMERLHLSNARKLSALIKDMGFPVLSNAGEKGVRLSWLIIFHGISWPDFMRESLLQMRMAAAQNDYILELLAYLDDRIAFFEGRKQLYGTNLDWVDGELKPTPIEDISGLDLRRKSFGLLPMAQTQSSVGHIHPPKDPVKKAQEYEVWLRKVGWRAI